MKWTFFGLALAAATAVALPSSQRPEEEEQSGGDDVCWVDWEDELVGLLRELPGSDAFCRHLLSIPPDVVTMTYSVVPRTSTVWITEDTHTWTSTETIQSTVINTPLMTTRTDTQTLPFTVVDTKSTTIIEYRTADITDYVYATSTRYLTSQASQSVIYVAFNSITDSVTVIEGLTVTTSQTTSPTFTQTEVDAVSITIPITQIISDTATITSLVTDQFTVTATASTSTTSILPARRGVLAERKSKRSYSIPSELEGWPIQELSSACSDLDVPAATQTITEALSQPTVTSTVTTHVPGSGTRTVIVTTYVTPRPSSVAVKTATVHSSVPYTVTIDTTATLDSTVTSTETDMVTVTSVDDQYTTVTDIVTLTQTSTVDVTSTSTVTRTSSVAVIVTAPTTLQTTTEITVPVTQITQVTSVVDVTITQTESLTTTTTVTPSATATCGVNLIQDGDFSTTYTSSWTYTRTGSAIGQTGAGYDSTYSFVALIPTSGTVTLSQTLNTFPGQQYTFSMVYKVMQRGIGGTLVCSFNNAAATSFSLPITTVTLNAWNHYSGAVIASSTSTKITCVASAVVDLEVALDDLSLEC